MNSIKRYRTAMQLTQKQLAEMVGTTQQSVAKWEKGSSEPSIQYLKDLALIFGTSIENLTNDQTSSINTNQYLTHRQESGSFWGHVGVKRFGEAYSTWYPITHSEANRISNQLTFVAVENSWVNFETLNNRFVALNTSHIKHIALLDDNADQVEGDWELGWDSYNGHSQEIYRALESWIYDEDLECSEAFKKTLKQIIDEHDLTDEFISQEILSTHVFYKTDSSKASFLVAPENLELIAFAAEHEFQDMRIMNLGHDWHGLDRYISSSAISMIDMPLHSLIEGQKQLTLD